MREVNAKHFFDERPWGHYESLFQGDKFQVKRIEINPHSRLSLQKHLKRSEKWIIVKGYGVATVGEKEIPVTLGSTLEVPCEALHRMANPHDQPLVFIEVQFGDYLGEDDIVRVHDDYNRHLTNS